MRKLNIRGFAVAATIAGAILAGCSGGGVKSLPSSAPQLSTQMVQTTLTFTIGSVTQSARRAQYIPSSTQSIVVAYIGSSSAATPVPGGATLPTGAKVAVTQNVTASGSNPPPPGSCVAIGSAYTCVVTVTLPVGAIDLYAQAFSGTNGTGTELASSVSAVQVQPSGILTAQGTSTPAIQPNAMSGNISASGASVSLAGALALTPVNALPVPAPTASGTTITAFPSTIGSGMTVSALQASTFKAADGTTIPSGNPITPVTITDTDTTGNTCLVYVKNGATTATPCPFAANSSVTLVNTGDTYAVQYNNKFIAGAGFTITAAVPSSAPTSTPAPQTVTVTSTTVTSGAGVTLGAADNGAAAQALSSGAIVYDAAAGAVYTGTTGKTNPLVKNTYSSSAGYGAPALTTIVVLNSGAGPLADGGCGGAVVGPDNNIWCFETHLAAATTTEHVAVYCVVSACVNAASATGATLAASSTTWSEYNLTAASAAIPTSIASSGGYIWVGDSLGQMWRINPSTGAVTPNKLTGCTTTSNCSYVGNAATVAAQPITTAAGGAITNGFNSEFVGLGANLFVGEVTSKKIAKLALDTTAAPLAGICTAAGPPPCIATVTESTNLVTTATAGTGETLYTDGTNIYVSDSAGAAFQYTTGLTQTPFAAVSFPASGGYVGGLAQGGDGWFWTSVKTAGASFIKGVTSTSTGLAGATNCTATGNIVGRGFMLGPDGTLLFNTNTGGTTSLGACGLVY